MSGIAAALTAIAVGLAVGAGSGHLPALRGRRPTIPLKALDLLLGQAGVAGVGSHQLLGACAAAALVAGGMVAAVTGLPALAVIPAALAGVMPIVVLRRRAHQRTTERRRAWPDALAQVSASTRAGRPLSHALVELSLTGPPALRGPFTGLAARIQTVGLEAALLGVRDTVADPVTDRVVEVLVLAHTEGGRIVVEVLDDLSAAIALEVRAAEELDTLALEGLLNARLVFALPWLVLVAMTVRRGPFRDFYASGSGLVVILFGAVLSLVGMTIVARLSRQPDEPRVLVGDWAAR